MAEIFGRLVGLETEYAIRFPSQNEVEPVPSKYRLFESIIAVLRRRIPTVTARYFKEDVFTANGGAVWFEAERPSSGGGLIEGATPECRGPRQVLAYQVAQDRLLADCALSSRHGLSLIKNDRDASDNVYGAQENYEVTLAAGWRLILWRIGLVAIFPLALLTWISILGCVLVTFAYFLLAGLVYLPIRMFAGRSERVAMLLFGRDISEGRDSCVHLPSWLEAEGFLTQANTQGWTQLHAWIHIVSDGAIFAALVAVVAIVSFAASREANFSLPPFAWLCLGALFLCGLSHLVQASLFWQPWHRLAGVCKLVAAIGSWLAVVGLCRVMPAMVRLPGIANRNKQLQHQLDKSKTAEDSLVQRVNELERINSELEYVSRGVVGREERILELKCEVNELLIRVGEPPRYLAALEPQV